MTAVSDIGGTDAPARLTTACATLPGIDLGAMEEQASLMTRVDRKYLVPASVAVDLLEAMAEDLHVLEIAGGRSFAYRSLYYDTPDLDAYRTAATKRRRRFKVRRREYVDSGTAFLEVKTRTGRGDTEKIREQVPMLRGEDQPLPGGEELTGSSLDYVRARLRDAGVEPPTQALLPVMETAYHRTTLLHGSEGSRVTLDRALTWRGTALQQYRLEDLLVLETKSALSPGAIDRFLWRAHHRPQRISKFATGMALLDPTLPANRWHRTLGRLRPQVEPPVPAAA
ncbi:polyphosphate polymerase domain-containing protein [Brachybacterium sp. AOP3-A1-3]|uniref:polyphosphate polymerase domain-containing protein n=1 Tax=Brachybacterium sp. AOP3-A1-3 TaxID=3457699 RepID=UPI0040347540